MVNIAPFPQGYLLTRCFTGQLLLQHRKMQSLAKPSPELSESLDQFLADRGQNATWSRKADDLVNLQPPIGTGWYGIGIVDLVREHCLAEVRVSMIKLLISPGFP